ncbi:MAG: phosphate/phosphite/phosphonate ABC transporter substrate-binding protein [Rhodobacteraceae bacterium]|nr:phosphate/phosphite/phosphonate ABC transporter substrate-binding protein [Paracoccaceae bacterium]MBR9822383.1 phosphate/phosphite/phosphonate ABC transporter substrate-binding protein [Paracoccaceae bacterium]
MSDRPGIATLPMYLGPLTRGPLQQLWSEVRAELGQGPEALTQEAPDLFDLWESPDLLLGQTCGLPFRSRLKGRVTYVGTTDPALPDTPPGHYRSVIVVRAEDPARDLEELAHRPAAANEPVSQSGWAALADHFAAAGVPLGPVHFTGAHRASAAAVASGSADLAALDMVTWSLMCAEGDATAARLRVLDRTRPTPAHPIITAQGSDPAPLARALSAALPRIAPDLRRAFGITRLLPLTEAEYFAVPLPPVPANHALS